MEVTPELERKLIDLAAKTGRAPGDLLEDAIPYLEELAGVREMLDGRYDDLKAGRVRPTDGEAALAHLRAKSDARRNGPA